MIPIVAIGGRCDIVGVVPTVATGGAVTIDYHYGGVIPIVATGGTVTVIVSIGVSFPLWAPGGAVISWM